MIWLLSQHRKTLFCWRFHFKTNQNNPGSCKKDLQKSSLFKRSPYSYVTFTEDFKIFHYVSFWDKFSEKQKPFTKKWGIGFSGESTTIEIAIFPYKTILSKANVETSKTGETKWAYQEERILTLTPLFFQKVYLIIRAS